MPGMYLETGKIVGTHGIKGELRVEPWCDSPAFLTQFETLYAKNGATVLKVNSARVLKNIVLMQLNGVTTVEQADKLRGTVLYINRNDVTLPEGRYFISDLLGLRVCDADNAEICYGNITDVLKTGANDIYQVTDDAQKCYLIPVIDDVVIETDLTAGIVRIRPMKGIFDDEN